MGAVMSDPKGNGQEHEGAPTLSAIREAVLGVLRDLDLLLENDDG